MSIPYYDGIAHHAMRRPISMAAVDIATGRHHTYQTFDNRISRLAASFQSHFDIKPGDRIAVLAPNTTDTFEVQFACGRIGAIFVPLNWRLAKPELRAILADCAPAALIFDPEFADRAQDLADGIGQILSLGPEYERVALEGTPLSHAVAVSLDDISTILYTSGTTGRPKGAIITHGMNFWNTVHSMSLAGIARSTVFLGLLPLFHTGGLNVFSYPVFQVGGTVLIMRSFDPGEALRVIGDPRPCGPRAVSRAGGARRFTPALGHLTRPRRPRPPSAAGRPAGTRAPRRARRASSSAPPWRGRS